MINTRPLHAYGIMPGLLLIPVFLWNLILAPYLPAPLTTPAFTQDLPQWLTITENSLRLLLFTLPFLMPWPPRSPQTRRGLWLFVTGLGIYCASWLPLILSPNSAWSTSLIGFLAPAYTPALWLIGISLIGGRLFWGHRYRWWMYLIPALLFLAVHITHIALIHARFHGIMAA